MKIANSKYGIVVAVARRARKLSEENKNNESYSLSTVVTNALDEIISGKVQICYRNEKSGGAK